MPVLARPVLGHSIICKSAFAEELLPRAGKLSLTFPVNNYDDDSKVHNNEARPLSENKWKLTLACDVSSWYWACGPPCTIAQALLLRVDGAKAPCKFQQVLPGPKNTIHSSRGLRTFPHLPPRF